MLATVNGWFERQWGVGATITEAELEEAERRWKKRKASALPPLPDPMTRERKFFNRLEAHAWETVFGWARAQPDVVAIRFGMTGKKGKEPNFQAIYKAGKPQSYRFPAEGGSPRKNDKEWDRINLTSCILVFRTDGE